VGGSRFEDKKNSTELSFLFVSIDILFSLLVVYQCAFLLGRAADMF
jgi:hypothetical protein